MKFKKISINPDNIFSKIGVGEQTLSLYPRVVQNISIYRWENNSIRLHNKKCVWVQLDP